jgi:hypothetical protein
MRMDEALGQRSGRFGKSKIRSTGHRSAFVSKHPGKTG